MNRQSSQPFVRDLMEISRVGLSLWRRNFSSRLLAVILTGLLLGAAAGSSRAADVVSSNSSVNNSHPSVSTNQLAASQISDFDVLDDKYRLAIGDQLSFRIIEDEEDPKQLVVTDSGDLQVPYIGRFPAVGKTCKELSAALKKELEKDYYRQATVIVAVDAKPKSRGKIYLVGAVRGPGPQDISSDEQLTVSKAILRAGGFAEFADQKNVRITRSPGTGPVEKQTFTVNVAQIFEKGKTELDVNLQPGDLIFIPERMIRF